MSPSAEPAHSQAGTRFARTLILFALMLTFLFAAMAYSSWTGTDPAPSPASAFAPRTEAVVTAATVRRSITNGSTRYYPMVTVEWPKASGLSRAVEGLEPSFYTASEDKAKAIIAPFKVGDSTTVRVVDARPIADRHDLYRIAHALFLSVFSVLCGLFTYLFFHASKARRKAAQTVRRE